MCVEVLGVCVTVCGLDVCFSDGLTHPSADLPGSNVQCETHAG